MIQIQVGVTPKHRASMANVLPRDSRPGAARYQLQTALSILQHVRGADHWMTQGVRARLRVLSRNLTARFKARCQDASGLFAQPGGTASYKVLIGA